MLLSTYKVILIAILLVSIDTICAKKAEEEKSPDKGDTAKKPKPKKKYKKITSCSKSQVIFQGRCLSACPTTTITLATKTCVCPPGQVYELGKCRAPCRKTQTRFLNGSCGCKSDRVFEVNQCRPPCTGGQIRQFDGECDCLPNQRLTSAGQCITMASAPSGDCPVGQVYELGSCRSPCLNGQIRQPNGLCACPLGESLINGVCTCPTDQTRDLTSGLCKCLKATDVLIDRTCKPRCMDTEIRQPDGSCKCPDDKVLEFGKCLIPCAQGQNRLPHLTCVCPEGQKLEYGQCFKVCPHDQVLQEDGSCKCRRYEQVLVNGRCQTA
jgi:hypothetical protein